MPRLPNIERSSRINLAIPESERAWLDLFLFSEAEQRVPKSAYQQFFLERLREFRERLQRATTLSTKNPGELSGDPGVGMFPVDGEGG